MRLPRRIRFSSTNSLVLIIVITLAFVLLIRRNFETHGAASSHYGGHVERFQIWETMKQMFSVPKHDEGQQFTMRMTTERMSLFTQKMMRFQSLEVNVNVKVKDPSLFDHTTIKQTEDASDRYLNKGHNKTTPESLSPIITKNRERNLTAIGNDLAFRTSLVEKECQRLSVFGTPDNAVRDIMTNMASKLAYCYIPKCGCTFWKRVIRFLNGDYAGRNVTSPSHIRRIETHSSAYSNPNTFMPFSVYRKLSKRFNSFMFVREPYARLWSAYVDKFYLPDFWSNFQAEIRSRRYPSRASRCVSDVTFPEFVSLSLETQEPHWDAMHQACDPCSFQPSAVGRVESFASDSSYILHRANLSWMMDGYDHDAHVQEELTTLINYNIELVAVKPYIGKCISKVGLFLRLWKAFQINGYLPANVKPPPLFRTTTTAEFTKIVLDQYRSRPNTPEVWRKQRKRFMIEAYKTLPSRALHAVRMKYTRDFILFNYNPRPDEIFGNRQ
ncbi:carbohydrate sulfotransferase 11-like [Haliotis rufescens]|uniref:carbohydrate sulfotransferase 11-like n=1 Tax=Haliotis rufescens TaxID=6454 RepID=UPI00201F5A40|nr:carbohydrate sulfotransferase 11-like [Haliotis rufescens]